MLTVVPVVDGGIGEIDGDPFSSTLGECWKDME